MSTELSGRHWAISGWKHTTKIGLKISDLEEFYSCCLVQGHFFFSFHSSHSPIYSQLLLKDMCVVCVSRSVLSDSLWPQGLNKLFCARSSPGKNTGVHCHSLLQGIFPIQRLNLGILSCRQIIYYLSHQGIYSVLSNDGSQAFTYLDSANKLLQKQHLFMEDMTSLSLLPQVLTNTSVSTAIRKTSA